MWRQEVSAGFVSTCTAVAITIITWRWMVLKLGDLLLHPVVRRRGRVGWFVWEGAKANNSKVRYM